MPKFNDPTTEQSYLEKDDVLMTGTPSEFANIKVQNMFSRSLTYTQLQALVTASSLVPAMWYKISNATSVNFNLLVQAIDVNKIGCDAKDPLYPNDVVKYNFLVNEVYEVEVNSYASFAKYSALNTCNKIGFGANEIDLGVNTINISSNVEYKFNGTTLIHTDDTKTFIYSTNKENFSITGQLIISGLKTTTQQNSTEMGIVIDNCSNYTIDNVIIKNCKGYGIYLGGGSGNVIRGNKGKFSNITLIKNNFPIYIDGNGGAEYNVFTNITASENLEAFAIYGGNNVFSSCNIVDNTKGVFLGASANAAHGSFSSCNINHNTDYNLYIKDILGGQDFSACHFYGDSNDGVGKIRIENSKAVNISDGHIAGLIEIIDGATNGLNMIRNNYFTSLVALGGNGLKNLILSGNFTRDEMSPLNTLSSSYVEANPSTNYLIASFDNVIFSNKVSDIRNSYNATNGEFTTPFSGVYEISINLLIAGTSLIANESYLGILKNNNPISYIPFGFNNSLILANTNTQIRLAEGDVITFTAVFSGSNASVQSTTSFIKIRKID